MSAPYAAFLAACRERASRLAPLAVEGRVRSLVGTVVEAEGLAAPVGALCAIATDAGEGIEAEVVGFREGLTRMMPLCGPSHVAPGARVRLSGSDARAPAAAASRGRILDGRGRPLDGGPPLPPGRGSLFHRPRDPLARRPIAAPLDVGVRAINALLTVGRGTRVGLFAGSGVGKSTLLGQITRFTGADVVVVALIGERGREVREFVERELGEALARSVVVVSTSDEAPILRRRAALLATALAEEFRDDGLHVLLLMDSLTRFCTAQREIGLAAGEPPATRGYPPSVWSALPQLLERAGNGAGRGSVTGIYTVLVEGDDLMEPVADAARALLDGHVVLSRKLAERGQYPAIDPLASVSRVMPDIVDAEALALARRAGQALAAYEGAEDLIAIGAYADGSDPAIDAARRLQAPLRAFLCQGRSEPADLAASRASLGQALAGGLP